MSSSSSSSAAAGGAFERNKQIPERFIGSIKSEVTKKGVLKYINAYMRFYHLYEEGQSSHQEQEEQQCLINSNSNSSSCGNFGGNNNKKNDDTLVYRYDWLIDEDIQTIQNRLIDFVNSKKKDGMTSKGIDNYINPLRRFYKINGIRGIDWELVQSCRPDDTKKTQDREYNAEEVIAIEKKLDVRGLVISGVMRGSGVRRGGVPSISVGDLFPLQTKYGKIYKIWVYRGSREMYATACIPEVADRIDDYFAYRMRFDS